MQSWLWYAVAATDSGYQVAYRSVFYQQQTMQWTYFPRNDFLLRAVSNREELQHLLHFSKGYYTVAQWQDTLVFNDLRFGQVVGWYDPKERFVFYYYLSQNNNRLVVQRGRFARWNETTIRALAKRIRGTGHPSRLK